ncbi:MAG: hypothetical protein ACOC9Y_10650 [Chloroflexota bacterium]
MLIGGGCLLILIIGLVGTLIAGGVIWDRATDEGSDWASDLVSEQLGNDISDRADDTEQVPESLPEPRSFSDEDAYVDFLRSHNQEAVSAVEELGSLLSSPQLNDDQWSDDVAGQIAVIRQVEERARQASPPDQLQSAHEDWTTAMQEFRRASDSTATALDEFDIGAIGEALDSMNRAARSYASMADSLREQGIVEDIESVDGLTPTERP